MRAATLGLLNSTMRTNIYAHLPVLRITFLPKGRVFIHNLFQRACCFIILIAVYQNLGCHCITTVSVYWLNVIVSLLVSFFPPWQELFGPGWPGGMPGQIVGPPGHPTSQVGPGLPPSSTATSTVATSTPMLQPRIPGSPSSIRMSPTARQEYDAYMQNRLRLASSQSPRPRAPTTIQLGVSVYFAPKMTPCQENIIILTPTCFSYCFQSLIKISFWMQT